MDEYSVQEGLFSRLRNRLSQIDQHTVLDAFIILLILIGLAASVYLAGQRQIFRSRAAQSGSVEVLNQNGEPITAKDEQGNPVVETQQIRLKIDFPTEWNSQGFLPINSTYAQSSQCDGNIYSCSDITCPDGSTAPGTGCYETGDDPNNRYRTECERNCPVNPASNIQPTPTSTPSFTQQEGCGLPWNGQPTQCSAYDNLSNCTYLDAWSQPKQTVCSESTPFCWACPESVFGAPPPAGGPTAPPPQTITQPPQGAAQPPTATPVPEQTVYIQVSLNKDKLGKDKCTSDPDPRQNCQEISVADLITKGYIIDWRLPPEAESYKIYIGFVSDKGNLKPDPPSVTVRYEPKSAMPPVGGNPAVPVQPTPTPGEQLIFLPTPTQTLQVQPTPIISDYKPDPNSYCDKNYYYPCIALGSEESSCVRQTEGCKSLSGDKPPSSVPTPTPTTPSSSINQSVILDPGHGNPDLDPTERKSEEGRLNLIIAQKTKDFLAQEGITAVLAHEANLGIPSHYGDLQKRVDVINEYAQKGAELFVAIHFDSGSYGSLNRGSQAYYNPDRSFSAYSKRLAELISASVSQRTNTSTKPGKIGQPDIGLDYCVGGCGGPLFVLGPQGARTKPELPESEIKRSTNIPGVLSEYFSKGLSYRAMSNDVSLTNNISKGYCDGILLYLENRTCN